MEMRGNAKNIFDDVAEELDFLHESYSHQFAAWFQYTVEYREDITLFCEAVKKHVRMPLARIASDAELMIFKKLHAEPEIELFTKKLRLINSAFMMLVERLAAIEHSDCSKVNTYLQTRLQQKEHELAFVGELISNMRLSVVYALGCGAFPDAILSMAGLMPGPVSFFGVDHDKPALDFSLPFLSGMRAKYAHHQFCLLHADAFYLDYGDVDLVFIPGFINNKTGLLRKIFASDVKAVIVDQPIGFQSFMYDKLDLGLLTNNKLKLVHSIQSRTAFSSQAFLYLLNSEPSTYEHR